MKACGGLYHGCKRFGVLLTNKVTEETNGWLIGCYILYVHYSCVILYLCVCRKTTSGSHYSLAVQVKLLVGFPEALWGLTEHGQYLPASQLLLLAHHTHTALQLSPTAAQVL